MSKSDKMQQLIARAESGAPIPNNPYPAPKMLNIPRRRDEDDLGYNTRMDDTGLLIEGELDFDQWGKVGEKISKTADKIQWVIGDWMLYGEKHWGHIQEVEGKKITTVYDIAENITGYTRRSLWRFKNVAEFYDGVNFLRRKSVKFTHHAIAYEEADHNRINDLLELADSQQLTVSAFRELLSPKQLPPASEEKASKLPGSMNRFRKAFTAQQYNRLSPDERRELRQDLHTMLGQIEKWDNSR